MKIIVTKTPVVFEADRGREEKIKVFHCIRPLPLNRRDGYLVAGHYEQDCL
ncbi:MAG: hypothetical protein ACK415_09460 [Thermodesulfovibrionales bacterium]